MTTDTYASAETFIFEHKERGPRWLTLFDILFLFASLIMIAIHAYFLFNANEYTFTKDHLNCIMISLVVWMLLAFFVIILNYNCIVRFNFHYIVTVDKDNFSIGIPDRFSVQTTHFSRQTEYQFNEKSRLVYMRSKLGHRYRFSYDETFRKFLEEIQIK